MGYFEELASYAVHHVPHDVFGLILEELSGVECQSPRILDIFPDPPVLDIAPTHRDSLSQIVFGLFRKDLPGEKSQSPPPPDISPAPPVLDIAPTHRDSLSQIVFGDELP